MKQLYLLRHAKSCWKDMSLCDHDRPLNKRGKKASAKIGSKFAEMSMAPDLVLCSTAVRASETIDRVLKAGNLDWNIQHEPKLYGASSDTILSLVHKHGANVDKLMIVGHNPGLADVAFALSCRGKPSLFERMYKKVPTGSFITLYFDVNCFSEVRARSGELTEFMRPKVEFANS